MLKIPPLRVSRPISACSRCRSAKIKCDGKLPACTACERAGKVSECSSGNDQFARGKERSYVASLETRIERLERQIYCRQNLSQPFVNLQQRQGIYPVTEQVISRKNEASDVDELVSDFGHLAVAATSNGYHGFDREMSLARLLISIATVHELPCAPDYPLPPRSVALDLLHACVANFFTLCPVMSFTAILGALERVYHHSGRLASPQDIWNVRICLAMGLSAHSRIRGDPQYESAICHVSVAIDTVGEKVIAPGSLARLRGFMLLVLYSTTNPEYFNSWYLIGMAARFMAEMGLHTSAGPHAEERRSLFLMIYGLDRYVSMSRLRPFSFSDDSADLTVPVTLTPKDILSNKELKRSVLPDKSVEDYAKSFIMLHQMQSSWYQALYYSDKEAANRPLTSRLAAIHENHGWLNRLPGSIQGPLKSRFLVQILYGSVLLVLPRDQSEAQCTAYAKALALEYICSYADAIEGLAGKAEPLGTTKNDDYLRTAIVSQRLLQIVSDAQGPVYKSPIDSTEDMSSGLLPQLTWTIQGNILIRITESLRKLDSALAWLNGKYEHSAAYRAWKTNFETALQTLYGHEGSSSATW